MEQAMKTRLLQIGRLGGLLLVVAAVSGCAQNGTATPPGAAGVTTNTVAVAAPAPADAAPVGEVSENAPPPEYVEPAPGSESVVLPAELKLSPHTSEIVKLARSGVDDGVMLAFITNSTGTFNLGSDQIVYLNDLGVAGPVITSMIEHDRLLREGAGALPPIVPAPVPVAPQAPAPDPAAEAAAAAPQALTPASTWTEAPPAPAAVEEVPAPPANVTYNYFYNSLSPYGTWVDIEGYGYCWQPTVAVVNVGWRPYVHGGRWIYSTYGWYWHSDYSWGWAPFHYGRWFSHPRWGWCWRPDTLWGPAWVSWRYTDSYCGWAPLPPAAVYTSGVGFTYYGSSVGFSFGFGLASYSYAFVAWPHFHSRHYHRHTVPSQRARTIYNNSTVVNNIIVGNNNTIINRGIEVDRVSRFTQRDIKPVRVRDVAIDNRSRLQPGERLERGGRELVVQRPRLPESPTMASGRQGRDTARAGNAPARNALNTSLAGAPTATPSVPRIANASRAERSREQAERNQARVEAALRGQRPAPATPNSTVASDKGAVPVARTREIRRPETSVASTAPTAPTTTPRSPTVLLTPVAPAASGLAKAETTPPRNEVQPSGSTTVIGRREPTPTPPRAIQPGTPGNTDPRPRPNITTTWTRPSSEVPRSPVVPRGSAPTPITRPTVPAQTPSSAPAATVTPPSVSQPQPAPATRWDTSQRITPAVPPPTQNFAPRSTPAPRSMPAPRSTPAPRPTPAPRAIPAPPAMSAPQAIPSPPAIRTPAPAPSVASPPRMQSRPMPSAPPRPSGGPARSAPSRESPRSR
jgi:hypothetical protein